MDNFRTMHGPDGDQWVAIGMWEDVLSKRGVPFLPFHFRGEGRCQCATSPTSARAGCALAQAAFARGFALSLEAMMAILTYPATDLDTAPETTAFRAIDAVVRADPTLKRLVGRNLYSWLGDALDDAEPTLDRCPWLRLTPRPGTCDWENEGQHRMDLVVGFELAVAGTNADQVANLWHAVRLALFPQVATRRAAVRGHVEANITKGQITEPAYGIKTETKAGTVQKMLLAGGALQCVLLINT